MPVRAFPALLALSLLAPSDAAACGGCFVPATTVTSVGGHRMALSLGTTETILWDQISYEGSPSDFVWVLPTWGTPTIELADDAFFEALGAATAITLLPPAPPRTRCGPTCPGGGLPPCIDIADAGGAPVIVHAEAVVGPYETVTVESSDPGALVGWLDARGYTIPASIVRTIDHYVALGARFTVLRLRPNAGVRRMQPVRVRSPGLSLSLPLRMIAAGAAVAVDLELFVFAEGRMEAASHPNAEVDRAAITYDWATRTFDYDARFEDALFAGDGPLTNWVTEFAGPVPEGAIRLYSSFDGATSHDARADLDLALAGGATYLTRLRGRPSMADLETDLVLRASEGSAIGPVVAVTRERNRPADVSCGGCAVRPGARSDVVGIALVLLLVAGRMLRRR